MQTDRPVPSPNPGTAPYWKAAREHRLMLPRCLACGKYHFYPRSHCPFCASRSLAWEPCSGKGVIYSFTEVFRAPSEAFAADVPYVVAIVALEEGPHLMTRLVLTSGMSPRIDQPVEVLYEDLDEELSLPRFRVMQEELK